jgi:hypothetical protein
MKFRFLTKLFGDTAESLQIIRRVYSRLSKAPFIRRNPQFWLQYAMSRMEVDDLENAEIYLGTALGLAKERGGDYSPYQILDQRARLYFKKNSEVPGKFKIPEIKIAIKDLTDVMNDANSEIVYLFRAVPLICEFLDMQIDECDKDLRQAIFELIEKINTAGEKYSSLPRSKKGETRVLRKAMGDVLLILRNA